MSPIYIEYFYTLPTPLLHHASQLSCALQRQHNRRPAWNIHLQEVLAVVPRKWRREEARALIHITMAAKLLRICAEHNLVGALLLDSNAVVGEAVLRVEVEDPEEASALKDNDLVALVLEADVGLGRVEPAVLLFGPLHLAVELVEVAVAEETVVNKVELAAGVCEAVVVAFTGKVEPFWVAELVTFKVEVALASEAVGDQADHLM